MLAVILGLGATALAADAAVVIGVEDYASLPTVPYAQADARAWQALLTGPLGLSPRQVQLLVDTPSVEEIEAGLERALAVTEPGDTLWVTFAGHGMAAPSDGGRLLLGWDADSLETIEARALRVDALQARAASARVELVLIADACFNGQGRDGDWLSDRRSVIPVETLDAGDALLWSATSAQELAAPLHGAQRGAFSYLAEGALRGWADGALGSPDGRVTAREAQAFVLDGLARAGLQTQQPVLAGPNRVLAQGDLEPAPELDWAALSAPRAMRQALRVQDELPAELGQDIVNGIVDRYGFLTLRTSPEAEAIYLNGAEVSSGGRWQEELMVGEYVLTATKALHHPAQLRVELDESGWEGSLELKPAYGALSVESDPSGATVVLDGQVVGTTPWTGEMVASGEHELRLRAPHHGEAVVTVEVRDGQPSRVSRELSSELGSLRVSSEPAGASIWLDGRDTGQRTPATLVELPQGLHELSLRLGGHAEVGQKVRVEAGEEAAISLEAPALLGLLSVLASDAGEPCTGEVLVDGQPVGTTPWKGEVLAMRHRVEVRCPGKDARATVEVPHNGKETLRLEVLDSAESLTRRAQEMDAVFERWANERSMASERSTLQLRTRHLQNKVALQEAQLSAPPDPQLWGWLAAAGGGGALLGGAAWASSQNLETGRILFGTFGGISLGLGALGTTAVLGLWSADRKELRPQYERLLDELEDAELRLEAVEHELALADEQAARDGTLRGGSHCPTLSEVQARFPDGPETTLPWLLEWSACRDPEPREAQTAAWIQACAWPVETATSGSAEELSELADALANCVRGQSCEVIVGRRVSKRGRDREDQVREALREDPRTALYADLVPVSTGGRTLPDGWQVLPDTELECPDGW